MGKLAGVSGQKAYEYAFRRYHDERFLPLIQKLNPTLELEVGKLPSLFLEHPLAGRPWLHCRKYQFNLLTPIIARREDAGRREARARQR